MTCVFRYRPYAPSLFQDHERDPGGSPICVSDKQQVHASGQRHRACRYSAEILQGLSDWILDSLLCSKYQ